MLVVTTALNLVPSTAPSHKPNHRTIRRGVVLALGLIALGSAQAEHGRSMTANMPKAYTQECGACHTAYAPGLLPARSWARIMNGLAKHYGTDASLDASTTQQLSKWLQGNAGTYKRVQEAPPQDRITRSTWFQHKHDGISATIWKAPSVKSAANCAACHPRADQGSFDEDELRAPKGIDPRLLQTWDDD